MSLYTDLVFHLHYIRTVIMMIVKIVQDIIDNFLRVIKQIKIILVNIKWKPK